MIPPLWTPAPIGSTPPLAIAQQGEDTGASTFAMLLVPPADAAPVSPEPEPMNEASEQSVEPRLSQHGEPRRLMPDDLLRIAQAMPVEPAVPEMQPAVASLIADESRRDSFVNDVPAGENAKGAQAQVFNHDGFFGTAIVAEPAPVASFEARSAEPEQPAASLAQEPAAADIPHSSAHPATMAARPSSSAPAATAAPLRVEASHTRPVAPTPPSGVTRPTPPTVRPRTGIAAPVRRPTPPPPTAFVAVAVQAVAHGLDIVARTDRHDPATAQLADEIAALLSRHGFPPGRITVLGPLPTLKER